MKSIIDEPKCISCKHYNLETGTCKAFPKEIPDEIYYNSVDHTEPIPNQGNNIVFEPKKESK